MYTHLGVVLLHGTCDAVKQHRDQDRGQTWNLYSFRILCRKMYVLQQSYDQPQIHTGKYVGRNIRCDLAGVDRLLKGVCNVLLECSSQLPKDSPLFFAVLNLLLRSLYQYREMIDGKRQQVRGEQIQALPNTVSGCNSPADACAPFFEHGLYHTHKQVFLALRKVVV